MVDRFGLFEQREDLAGFRLRIDVLDVVPQIWRRVEVPSSMLLSGLHTVVQAVVGWQDLHLHVFSYLGDMGLVEFESPGLTPGGPRESAVRVDQVLREVGDQIGYLYDMGDMWGHAVRLEKVVTRKVGDESVKVISGRRAGPPEDCGGPYGYRELLRSARDKAAGRRLKWEDAEALREHWPRTRPQTILEQVAEFDIDQARADIAAAL